MALLLDHDRLQLWGGIECTVNRVGDIYLDQIVKNGHVHRDDDLDRIATLQLSALRYPVLWERTAPHAIESADWEWTDRQLSRLRSLNIVPIAGLVHHGSGPRHTDLLQSSFPLGLAQYAHAVASRYPWMEAYTPVNEPLTTARFSALYGHWYPHQHDDLSFVLALIHQCVATSLCMSAIRRINPLAKLVLTEDLSKVHSTPRLADQAAFENERRWLSVDLMLGRVTRQHALWNYLARTPALTDLLLQLADAPCPPDILGFNYYVTSERLLDERIERYPVWTHGGNGRVTYADVEAVRARSEGIDGCERLMNEAWQRYHRPMAITEVHLGGHREQQVRWLLDSWNTAHALRAAGVDLRAITVWSLLGAYDWNSLCTQETGCYESGALDVRGEEPRLTAVAHTAQKLATDQAADTSLIPERGWWETDSRLCYPPVVTEPRLATPFTSPPIIQGQTTSRPLLILGGNGMLGRGFIRVCEERRLAYRAFARAQLDVTNSAVIQAAIETYHAWGVVNAAGWSNIDEAELNPAGCHAVNYGGAINLATECAAANIPMLTFSSNLVFDGSQGSPYQETDETGPLSAYGRIQCDVERGVLALYSHCLIVRTSLLFCPWSTTNFLGAALQRLRQGLQVVAADDWVVSPTYVPDLANACLDLLIDREKGIWHLANGGQTSWAELVHETASVSKLPRAPIITCAGETLGLAAPRPSFSALVSHHGQFLPMLSDAIHRYVKIERSNGELRGQQITVSAI